MDGLIYKSITQGVKDIDLKNRIVTGYLSETDTEDKVNDIILSGSYKKTLQERKSEIFFLNQHNWNQPHGKFAVLQEDSKGLYFESEPLIDTSYSTDALKLYEAGIMTQHSIGYSVVKSTKNAQGVREISELKLYEGSNVTLGAHPNTPFTGFKSLTQKEVDTEIKKILKAFRNGTFTDDTFMLLEVALKQLQKKSFELGKLSLEKPQVKSTLTDESIQAKVISDYINTIKND